MRLVELSNVARLNAEHITRLRYIDAPMPELTIWYLGATEPIQITGEAARTAHAAIAGEHRRSDTAERIFDLLDELADEVNRLDLRIDDLTATVPPATGAEEPAPEPPVSLRGCYPLALAARFDRIARDCREEADEPGLPLATRNLFREAAAHLAEASRRAAAPPPREQPIDPLTPRRFRWPRNGTGNGNGGGWNHGVYLPRRDWTETDVSGHVGVPNLPEIEWIDPAPEAPR